MLLVYFSPEKWNVYFIIFRISERRTWVLVFIFNMGLLFSNKFLRSKNDEWTLLYAELVQCAQLFLSVKFSWILLTICDTKFCIENFMVQIFNVQINGSERENRNVNKGKRWDKTQLNHICKLIDTITQWKTLNDCFA